MAQLTTTAPFSSLRAEPGLAERLDAPRRTVFIAAVSMIAIMVLLVIFIAGQGIQLFVKDGHSLGVLTETYVYPDTHNFGMLPFIAGTVCVTALAVGISAPLSVGLAIFLSEIAPAWARGIVQPALEIFVGIPSVVWGLLGLTTLIPLLKDLFGAPIVISLPGLGRVFSMPGFAPLGYSWLAGSLVVGIMILPTITSVAYDAFAALPRDLRTGSLALGTTRWQTIRHILIPAALPGVLTGVVLGMARAAGEALALAFVVGNPTIMPSAISQPLVTLTTGIATDMTGTVFGSEFQDALWTMALILLVLSTAAVILVHLINRRRIVL
jgi:phosphate transport system permease protein